MPPLIQGLLAAFSSREVTIHEVPIEEDGLDVDELETLIQTYQPKLLLSHE